MDDQTARLVGQYLPASTPDCPTFVDDSEWVPIIDGVDYCAELADALDRLGPGDGVALVGLSIAAEFDLRGRDVHDRSACPLGEQLAQAAARGADVLLLIAGKAAFGTVPPAFLGPFAQNIRDVRRFRRWRPAGSSERPLADRVAFDFSGPRLGSNHQKIAVLRIGGQLTAYVGGVDLVPSSRDAAPHDTLRLHRRRWGWHDVTVRLRGPAAARVDEEVRRRWEEVRALPERQERRLSARRVVERRPVNPARLAPALPPIDPPAPVHRPGVAVRVLRSVSPTAVDSWLPWRRAVWQSTPVGGFQEIFETLTAAIAGARRFIYVEDQYLAESLGASARYELYPHLRDAVERGVKLIFVGSGVRDPEDLGPFRPINRTVNRDIRRKIIDALPAERRSNVVVWRVEHATVHAKVTLIDDVFANVGSANLFARSMSGVDTEISSAVVTSTPLVRDLRVALWAEHLRAPLTAQLREALGDLDLALGMWRPEWLPPGSDAETWRRPGTPGGYQPSERVLSLVGPR